MNRSTGRSRIRSAAMLAAAGAVLVLASAGCSPTPTDEDGRNAPAQEQPSTPDTAPTDEQPSSGSGTATGAPSEDGTPQDGSPQDGAPQDGEAHEGDDGAGDDGTGGESEQESVVDATNDWKAPDDPTAEGPTAAPALPEVNGRIGEDVSLPTEVVVTLTSISTTSLTAETPGEYSGPAVVVGVRITNESDAAQSVGSAVVSLVADDGAVGVPTWASPNAPLRGEVQAGASVEGTYVFMIEPADERSVTVRVNPSAGAPVATFTGTTP